VRWLLGLMVSGLWLACGLGCVPAGLLLAGGALLWQPFPELGRHLLRLGARVAWPLGTRVVDFEGRGSLRWFPLLAGGALAAEALERLDPDQLLEPEPEPLEPVPEEELARAALSVAWVLLVGWELLLFHLLVGLLLRLTLVGAPFGVRHWALAAVALVPLEWQLLRAGEAPGRRPRARLRGRG
jgi:uncharacterized membrane protein YccF (DUF307 family)